MVSYFNKTDADALFYKDFIKDRLPDTLLDMHVHFSKPEFEKNVDSDALSWAFELEVPMPMEDYRAYANALYPDKTVLVNALPTVKRGLDDKGLNEYIKSLGKSNEAFATHMLVLPTTSVEELEEKLPYFDGVKPYPDLATVNGREVGIFDFITHEQLKIVNKYKKSFILHLPRKGRFPDSDNISELRRLKDMYPDIRVTIAHCGRSYAINTITVAKEKFGSDINAFYYDFTAVLNPKVIEFMLEYFPNDRLFYGTDLPIFLFHGKRRWTDDDYFNLVAENFSWNTHEEGTEAESRYTFFLYEQLKNLLDASYKHGGKELAEKIFFENAKAYLKK